VYLSLQEDMLQTRRKEFENSIVELTSWDGFVKALDDKKMVRTPWWGNNHFYVFHTAGTLLRERLFTAAFTSSRLPSWVVAI